MRILFFLLFLALPAAAAERTVLFFGDSLAAAYGISPSQGWVNLLSQRLPAPWKAVNASVSGETTDGGLRRLSADLERHKPSMVVIALGANDALRGQPIAGIRDTHPRLCSPGRLPPDEPSAPP